MLGIIGLPRPSKGTEMDLRKVLFANYSKNQRPSTPVNISLNLVVLNIDEVVSDAIEENKI